MISHIMKTFRNILSSTNLYNSYLTRALLCAVCNTWEAPTTTCGSRGTSHLNYWWISVDNLWHCNELWTGSTCILGKYVFWELINIFLFKHIYPGIMFKQKKKRKMNNKLKMLRNHSKWHGGSSKKTWMCLRLGWICRMFGWICVIIMNNCIPKNYVDVLGYTCHQFDDGYLISFDLKKTNLVLFLCPDVTTSFIKVLHICKVKSPWLTIISYFHNSASRKYDSNRLQILVVTSNVAWFDFKNRF